MLLAIQRIIGVRLPSGVLRREDSIRQIYPEHCCQVTNMALLEHRRQVVGRSTKTLSTWILNGNQSDYVHLRAGSGVVF